MSILPPPFAKKTSPLRFVILLEDVISPFVLYIDKSPFLLIMEPLISKPFLDDISTPWSSLINSALIVSFSELPLFWIRMPFVASMSFAPLNSKLPFLLSISILPSDVLMFESNWVFNEFVSIPILPFVFIISPFIVFEPLDNDIKILP